MGEEGREIQFPVESELRVLALSSLQMLATSCCAVWRPPFPKERPPGCCAEVWVCRDNLLVQHRTCHRKVPSSIPAGAAGQCSSPELTLCADSYSVSIPPPSYRNGT